MENTRNRRLNFILVVVIALVALAFYGFFKTPATKAPISVKQVAVSDAPVRNDYFSYRGVEGKDALTLLKAHTKVGQDKSGLVVSINGRKADNAKHEYWAFLVNGKMAQVGSAEYQTRDGDIIEWKIDHY